MIWNRIFLMSFSHSFSRLHLLLFSLFNILRTIQLAFYCCFNSWFYCSLLTLFFTLVINTSWGTFTWCVFNWHLLLCLFFCWESRSDHFFILLPSCSWLLVSCLVSRSKWIILRSSWVMLFWQPLWLNISLWIVHLWVILLLLLRFIKTLFER